VILRSPLPLALLLIACGGESEPPPATPEPASAVAPATEDPCPDRSRPANTNAVLTPSSDAVPFEVGLVWTTDRGAELRSTHLERYEDGTAALRIEGIRPTYRADPQSVEIAPGRWRAFPIDDRDRLLLRLAEADMVSCARVSARLHRYGERSIEFGENVSVPYGEWLRLEDGELRVDGPLPPEEGSERRRLRVRYRHNGVDEREERVRFGNTTDVEFFAVTAHEAEGGGLMLRIEDNRGITPLEGL